MTPLIYGLSGLLIYLISGFIFGWFSTLIVIIILFIMGAGIYQILLWIDKRVLIKLKENYNDKENESRGEPTTSSTFRVGSFEKPELRITDKHLIKEPRASECDSIDNIGINEQTDGNIIQKPRKDEESNKSIRFNPI